MTLLPLILPLIPVDRDILSSYDRAGKTGGPREQLMALYQRASGVMIPDAASALLQLQHAVEEAGGDLRITDCHRSAAVQAAAHQAYLDGKKKAFVAEAGRSNHNGGRAVDIHLGPLGISLEKLWEIMKPLGFSPVIRTPDPKLSEAWHIEWRGELKHLFVAPGPGYADAALAGALLVGHAGQLGEGKLGEARLVQALVHRAGFNCGAIDGMIGEKTKAGMAVLLGRTLPPVDAIPALKALATPGRYLL